jgi:hypothetical protein
MLDTTRRWRAIDTIEAKALQFQRSYGEELGPGHVWFCLLSSSDCMLSRCQCTQNTASCSNTFQKRDICKVGSGRQGRPGQQASKQDGSSAAIFLTQCLHDSSSDDQGDFYNCRHFIWVLSYLPYSERCLSVLCTTTCCSIGRRLESRHICVGNME